MNYKKFLRIDLEKSVRVTRMEIEYLKSKLDRYPWTESEKVEIRKQLSSYQSDLRYYSLQLAEMGGAENEEILTESKDSESPQQDYNKLGCVIGR